MLKFSAISKSGKTVYFTLEDCPVYITTDQVVLAKHENSDIVIASTIVRYDDVAKIAEGDRVYDGSNEIGVIVYSAGFMLLTKSGNLKELEKTEHIKLRKGNTASRRIATQSKLRESMLFQYKQRIFSMKALVRYEDGFIIVHTSGDYYWKVVADDIRFLAGVDSYCFGDLMENGGRVVMHELKPSVVLDNNFTNLSEFRRN